ncbi:hypothetical protein I5Q34_32760 [Streptomyces sp. AV19]|uniref:hypothetical protein n=1 Tax=Streptomyces sp. AV19 TaxID=2793068 RepID=UPI0018FF00BF|nr:hypothetical protein [Streptomyces sp. AV19]MBH1938976.1 hypothetical protein [Streptomyces sp. AV19]MDG4536846.1 hypothetical protein [Streptomyces sp. AV19]
MPEILSKKAEKGYAQTAVVFVNDERDLDDTGFRYERLMSWQNSPGQDGSVIWRPDQVSIKPELEDGNLVFSCAENSKFSKIELELRVDPGMNPAFPGPWRCMVPADGREYSLKFSSNELPGVSMEDLLNGYRNALFNFRPIEGEASEGYYQNSVLDELTRILGATPEPAAPKPPKIWLTRGLDRGEYYVSWENGERNYTKSTETRWQRRDLFFEGNESRIEEPMFGVTYLKGGHVIFGAEKNEKFTALVAEVSVKPTSSWSEHFTVNGTGRGLSGEVIIPADGNDYVIECTLGGKVRNIEQFFASGDCVASVYIRPIESDCPESEYPAPRDFRVRRADSDSPGSDVPSGNDAGEIEVIDSVSVCLPTCPPSSSGDAAEDVSLSDKLGDFALQGWAGKTVPVAEVSMEQFKKALNAAEEAVKARFADRNAELAKRFIVDLRSGYEDVQPVFTKGTVAAHAFNNGFAAWGVYAAFKPGSEASELGKGSAFAGFASSSLGTMGDLYKAAKVSKAVGKAVAKAAVFLGIISDGLSLADNIQNGDRKAIAADTMALVGGIASLAFPPAILLSLPSIWLAIESLIWDAVPTYENLCEELRQKIISATRDCASKIALLLEIQAVHTAHLNKAIVAVHREQNPGLEIGPNLKASLEFIDKPGLIDEIMKKVEKEVQAAIVGSLLKPAVEGVKNGIDKLVFAPTDDMMARFFNGPDNFRKMLLEWDRHLRNLKADLTAAQNIKKAMKGKFEQSRQDSDRLIEDLAAKRLGLRPESQMSAAIKEHFYAQSIGYEEAKKKNLELTIASIERSLPKIFDRLKEIELLEADLQDDLEKIEIEGDITYLSISPTYRILRIIANLISKASSPDFTEKQIKELYKGYVEFLSTEMAGHITAKGLERWSKNEHNDCFHQQTQHS